ncbi:hypothetical protein C8R42DRAFT_780721 [Lentinula raphanica]|nr:hypothetical protein C8R42DRAFT_780721 [Lentinula raphanica]
MYEEEIIADSEGEDELFGPPVKPAAQAPTTNAPAASTPTSADVSRISDFSTNKLPTRDTISNFSAPSIANAHATSTIDTNTSSSRSRPKPRPLPKTIRPTASGDSFYDSFSSTSNIEPVDMTLSIADRAKMRKRNSEIIHNSIEPPVPAYSPEIIELSSDDELALRPAKKPKKPKKTTAEKKNTKKASSATAKPSTHIRPPSPILESDADMSLSFALPMVSTSSAIPRNLYDSSALPPSDPPMSTPSELFDDIPGIETLPNPPSSSTSASTSYAARKSHTDSDMDMLPPPPPPFFADPSSSPFEMNDMNDIPGSNANDGVSRSTTTTKVIAAVSMPPPPVPSTKARKSRTKKKKQIDDEDELMMDDEDWTGEEPKGKKAKGKSKGKDKAQEKLSSTAKASDSSSTQVKGKGKAPLHTSASSRTSHLIDLEHDDQDVNEMLLSTITIPPSPQPERQRSSPTSKRARDRHEDDPFGEAYVDHAQAPRKKPRRSDVDVETSGNADVDVSNNGRNEQMKASTNKATTHTSSRKKKDSKGKNARVVFSDDEDELEMNGSEGELEISTSTSTNSKGTRSKPKSKSKPGKRVVSEDEDDLAEDGRSFNSSAKENISPSVAIPQTPVPQAHIASTSNSSKPPTPATDQKQLKYPTLVSRYTIAPKSARKSTPMSDLIRRVNSMPNSQFKSPMPRGRSIAGGSKGKDTGDPTENGSITGSGGRTAYSPYLKSSRTFLSRIAPLHPNRRTPPPLPPAPPPRKKTRKEMEWEKKDKEEKEELEERWEEELVERVGGVGEWLAMGEEMRKAMKRAKRDRELGRYVCYECIRHYCPPSSIG